MKAAARPEVLTSTKDLRLVAVPVEYDGGPEEQDRNRFDLWKDREACRELRLEIAVGSDSMGVTKWSRVQPDNALENVVRVRALILGFVELLDQAGAFGDTKLIRDALTGEGKAF